MRFRPSFLPPKIFTPRVVLSAWISVLCVSAPVLGPALADRFADIARTKHNLSVTGPGDVRSQEDRICVFCHTPHAANDKAPPPLWNRKLSGATYRPYESSSFDAGKRVGWLESAGRGQPGGASKLCLSCHDGTVALGSVLVLDGRQNQNINVSGTAPDGTIPEGKGASTGFTRRLGVDLTNEGDRSTIETVQLYLSDPVARVTRPVRELKDFRRITLQPGETGHVRFTVTAAMQRYPLAPSLEEAAFVRDPGRIIVHIGPNSRDTQALELTWHG